MRLEYDVAAGDFTRAGNASSAIKKTLKQLGVSTAVIKRVVVAVYEAEVNIVAHSYGGHITADMMGFGAGMGLPNIQENADDLKIETGVGRGTTLSIYIKF